MLLQVCAVYCLDSQFVTEANKFIAGSLQVLIAHSMFVNPRLHLDEVDLVNVYTDISSQALAAMVQLEVPHISVLTKVDLLQDKVRRLLPQHSRLQWSCPQCCHAAFQHAIVRSLKRWHIIGMCRNCSRISLYQIHST